MKVEIKGVSKSFGGVKALDNIQLEMESGVVNCLVGENGAGKSTIIKILAGDYFPEEGDILVDGKKVEFRSPKDSQNVGIAVMHQELLLIPEMSVAENIVLGRWPKGTGPIISKGEMYRIARENLAQLDAHISPSSLVRDLSTGEQQMVEVARALSQNAKLLIMDEPTAALSEVDSQHLLDIVRKLKGRGISILYVSHRLEEVMAIADKITVFRDGQYVDCKPKGELEMKDVVRMMVGREVQQKEKRDVSKTRGHKVMEVRGYTSYGNFEDIDFDLYEGEVLGLAGLVGAGRSEIVRAIFGMDKFDEGTVIIDGYKKKIRNPVDAMNAGMGFVPEDRKTQGLVLIRSVKDNIVLTILNKISKMGFINKKLQNSVATDYKKKLRIKTASLNAPVESLSGGNQQKVAIARALAIHPKILLLDEPTRGVDVGARDEIHKLIDQAVEDKMAVLVISSDLVELLDISDRVIVLKEGRITGSFDNTSLSKEEVLHLATV